MPKKKSYPTATDGFCGAGGSTQGLIAAGIEVKVGLNHWKLATETYATNNPNALVDCTDISACDPRRYPSTDLGVFSPECTTHSPAGGNTHKKLKQQMDMFESCKIDPATERSRATMWDVVRFAEYHNYNALIIENVVEAKTSWPLFEAWLNAMHLLGYMHKCVYLNSMHFHPTPQSRDRMYVVFWKKGNHAPILEHTPLAHCSKCGKDVNAVQTWKNKAKPFGKYRKQYVYCCPHDGSIVEPYYYAAFNVIDWSNIGRRIGDIPNGLSANTIKRIKYGREKYPFHNLAVNDQHSTGIGFRVQSLEAGRFDTLPTTPHIKIVMPFIIKNEHAQSENMVRSVLDATQTQATRQTMTLVTPPFAPTQLTNNGQQSNSIITDDSWNSFISYYYKTPQASHITEALNTATTKDRMALYVHKEPAIEDCYYRTLKPKEVKLAMAFNEDYKILGSGKEQVKQLGNAVTPPAMKWLAQQVVESLK